MRFTASRLFAAALCIAIFTGAEAAQPGVQIPVVLRYAGADPVGQALAAAIEEQLAMAENLRSETTEFAEPRIVVIMTTVDGSVEDPEKQTAASVSILYDADTLPLNGYLITTLVQVCGITRTRECAQEIIDTVNAALLRLQDDHPDLWSSLQPP